MYFYDIYKSNLLISTCTYFPYNCSSAECSGDPERRGMRMKSGQMRPMVHRISPVQCVPCSRRLSFALHLRETQMSVWVYKRAHAESEGKGREGEGRERSAVSHGCELLLPLLQKISPRLLRSPPPHLASIIPVFSEANPR